MNNQNLKILSCFAPNSLKAFTANTFIGSGPQVKQSVSWLIISLNASLRFSISTNPSNPFQDGLVDLSIVKNTLHLDYFDSPISFN